MQNKNTNITRHEQNKQEVSDYLVLCNLTTADNYTFPLVRANADLISLLDFKVNTNISRRQKRNVLLHSV